MIVYVAITDVNTWGKSTTEAEAIARALVHSSRTPSRILLTELYYQCPVERLKPEQVLSEVFINEMGNLCYPNYEDVPCGLRNLPLIEGKVAERITSRWNSYNLEVQNAIPN